MAVEWRNPVDLWETPVGEQYGLVEREGWGEGPWEMEPDRVEWTDKGSGLRCLIIRHPEHGQLNGYVCIGEGHPAYHKHYNNSVLDEVMVHGGLTYTDTDLPMGENKMKAERPKPPPRDPSMRETLDWLAGAWGQDVLQKQADEEVGRASWGE